MSLPVDKLPQYIKGLAGKRLHKRYTINSLDNGAPDVIGVGTSAYVLKATAPLESPKAIKVLRKERASDGAVKDRFLSEVDKLTKVRHTNIISVEDHSTLWASDDSGKYELPYYVMEFIDGKPIDEWADEREKQCHFLSVDAVCSLIRQMVTGLAHVHSASPQIFHLDLKPSNIIIAKDGTPKLGDFGLALVVGPSAITGAKPSGREFAAMHPDFLRMVFSGVIDPSALRPQFDLFGLGYTLSKVESFLKYELDQFRKYIFDAMVLRLTVAQKDDKDYPARRNFRTAERDVPEYDKAEQLFEALDKLHNPDYHITNIPELHLEPSLPPVRISRRTHVPTTERLRKVLDTPVFQRLEWMKQLDHVHYVYPGAEHTRREHALGVYYYTIRYLRRLLREPYFVFNFSCEDVRATLLAALLHDIGHYPMAHAISESQNLKMGNLATHESIGERILLGEEQYVVASRDQKELRRLISKEWKVPQERVADIAYKSIDYPSWAGSIYEARRHNLLHSIIDGPLDTDKVHYLQFDSIHSGNPVGASFDSEQLVDSLTFTRKFDGLAVTDKGIAAVESFLHAYYRMHVDVYWHHTVRGARKMVARAIDWYIKEPRDGTRQRRDKVRKAVMMLTDRDFLEWFVAQPRPESPAGQLIRHLVRIEKRGDFQLVRPIRGVFKRFRTYTKNGRGDKASKTIFDLLSQDGSIDVLKYEKNVAKGLSNLIRQQIAAWEIIIDIPRSEEGEMSEVSVWYPKVKQEEYAHKALEEIRHMAKEMKESYVDDSKKIRIYCSPRVRQWLMARETELNSSILQSIKETQAKSVPE